MILLNLNHALRYTELLSDYAGTYPQHIHWISVLLCIYKGKKLTFDAEFHEDMYINIWHIKVRSSTLSWGRKRNSVQCLQKLVMQEYISGWRGKKLKRSRTMYKPTARCTAIAILFIDRDHILRSWTSLTPSTSNRLWVTSVKFTVRGAPAKK